MSINSKEVMEILDNIKKKLVHYCLICGDDCQQNVCIRCESKADARKVLFHCYRTLKALQEHKLDIQGFNYKKRQIIEFWDNKINYTDLSCYTQEQRDIIFDVFDKEINDILSNYLYYDLIYKPTPNGVPQVPALYMLENLRTENIHNICLGCNLYPCRYTKDSNLNIRVIKECKNKK